MDVETYQSTYIRGFNDICRVNSCCSSGVRIGNVLVVSVIVFFVGNHDIYRRFRHGCLRYSHDNGIYMRHFPVI